MSVIKMEVKWGKFNTSKIARNMSDVLLIQNVPVAFVRHNQGMGYYIEFVDEVVPSKPGKYYVKRSTAIKNCEKRFGISSSKYTEDLWLTGEPIKFIAMD